MREYLRNAKRPIGRRCYKRKRTVADIGLGYLSIIGIISALGITTFLSPDTHAAAVDVTITVPASPGNGTLNPGSSDISFSHYQVPVGLVIENAEEFGVYISSSSSNLTGKNFSGTITPLATASETSVENFRTIANRWGYRWYLGDSDQTSVDNGLNTKGFKGITGSDTKDTITTNVATEGDYYNKTLTLEFAATADGSLASDNYTNDVTISVVATPKQATLFDITTMQEITHDICDATPTPEATKLGNDDGGVENWATSDSTHYASTLAEANAALSDTDDPNHAGRKLTTKVPQVTLTDTRGNGHGGTATYLVRKLADGNCWMSQNLELDFLGTGQSYYTGVTSDSAAPTAGNNDSNKTYYNTEDDGRTGLLVSNSFRLTDADTDLHTTTVWTPDYMEQINNAKAVNYATYATMTGMRTEASNNAYKYGWKFDGSDGLRSYSTAASNSSWAYSTLATAGDNSTSATFSFSATGEAYQRTGNLYNWTAATLGSSANPTTDGQNAEDSICPKGWKLPGNSGNDSFIYLLQAYDPAQDWNNYSGDNMTGYNKLASSPLDFFRTGRYDGPRGYLHMMYTHGQWWSSTVLSTVLAYNLYTYRDVVSAHSGYARGSGFAVRCVAR